MLPVTGLSVFATKRVRDHLARGLSQAISQTFTVHRLQLDAAGRRRGDQFLGAAVLRLDFRPLAQGARRSGALGHAARRICRRPHRRQTGRRLDPARSAVRARQCRHVWQRHRRGARHEQDRIGQHFIDVADGDASPSCTPFCSSSAFAGRRRNTPGFSISSGIANAAAQYLWTRALHAAPATAVSPFYYFLLVWTMFIGFFVWGDMPTISLLVGSGIVVASGLFLLYHEAHRETARRRS